MVSLDNRCLCVSHLIATGYECLDKYARTLSDHQISERDTEEIWQFLSECTERVADVTESAERLDNLQRARLLDILLRAADLSRRLRRSPRCPARIPVRLHSEKLGRAWEEETWTRKLSRHGALVECRHPVETNDVLTLVRLDTSQEAKARVVWRKQDLLGVTELGLELLNCENFWGPEWSKAGFIPPQTSGAVEPGR